MGLIDTEVAQQPIETFLNAECCFCGHVTPRTQNCVRCTNVAIARHPLGFEAAKNRRFTAGMISLGSRGPLTIGTSRSGERPVSARLAIEVRLANALENR